MYKIMKFCGMLIGKGANIMYAEFVKERITQLRLQKGISEYKMSYDLGHSRGYVNNISSGKALPSMAEFFAICEYFGITPIEFFKTDTIYCPTVELVEGMTKEEFQKRAFAFRGRNTILRNLRLYEEKK